MPVTGYLELAQAVPLDGNPLVWNQVARTFVQVDRLFDGSVHQSEWRQQARDRLQPVFARVGWSPASGEHSTVALLRESLIVALGRLDDAEVIAGAKQRFLRSARDPQALPAAIRQPVLDVVALHADTALWEEILRRARSSRDPVEQLRLFSALGAARDPALARRALELSLSGVPPVTFAPSIMAAVSYDHPRLAFEFGLEHEEQVLSRVEVSSRWAFIPSLPRTSSDAAVADAVRAHVDASVPADVRQPAEVVIAGIRYQAKVKAARLPELEEWVRRVAG
jgi:aminopeptidase N